MASDGPLPLEPSRDSVISHPSGQDRSSRGIHRGASAGLRSPSLCPRRHECTSAVAWSRSDLAPSGRAGEAGAGRGGTERGRGCPGRLRTGWGGRCWAWGCSWLCTRCSGTGSAAPPGSAPAPSCAAAPPSSPVSAGSDRQRAGNGPGAASAPAHRHAPLRSAGGSSGIGAAAALELARCGARVILATRSARRGEAAASRIRRVSTGTPAEPRHSQPTGHPQTLGHPQGTPGTP